MRATHRKRLRFKSEATDLETPLKNSPITHSKLEIVTGIESSNLSVPFEAKICGRNGCVPLAYSSPNALRKEDVVGTLLLAVLVGNKRYAHVTTVCADSVQPELLGISSELQSTGWSRSRRGGGLATAAAMLRTRRHRSGYGQRSVCIQRYGGTPARQ